MNKCLRDGKNNTIIWGDSTEDIDDSEYCHNSDFEDEIDTDDEDAAAAMLVDLAIPKHLQPGASGGDHSQCSDGASGRGQDGYTDTDSHSEAEGFSYSFFIVNTFCLITIILLCAWYSFILILD